MESRKLSKSQLNDLQRTIHGGQAWRMKDIEDYSHNLNPLGPPSDIADIISEASSEIWHYPDDSSSILKETISKRFDVQTSNIIIGSGSSDIIRLFPAAFMGKGDKAIVQRPTFSEYSQQCKIAGAQVVENELKGDFRIDFSKIKENAKGVKAIYICNPNNPTGVIEKRDDILNLVSFCSENETFVFVDETLLDLIPEHDSISCAGFVNKYDNLIVIKSLTKSFAIPGIRIGYGISSSEIIEQLDKVRTPWNVGQIEQHVANILLSKRMEHVKKAAEMMKKEKEWMYNQLMSIGFPAVKTDSYFFFNSLSPIKLKTPEFKNRMLESKIMIRDCSSFGTPFDNFVRFCVKDRTRNEKFVEAVRRSMR